MTHRLCSSIRQRRRRNRAVSPVDLPAPVYDDGMVVLYHADARDLAGRIRADLVIADPPYGETSLEWDRWLSDWPGLLDASSMWCFGSMRMFIERGDEFREAGWRLSQDLVWEKHNGSSFHADRFKRVHEAVTHWYRGAWADIHHETPTTPDARAMVVRRKQRPSHTGEIAYSTYVSHDGGPRLMRSVIYSRSCHGYALHPTQKPTAVIEPLIVYGCPPGGLVLDPFAGSGSSLLAARATGRRAVGIEVREEYVEAAISRLAQGTLDFAGTG